MTAPRPFDHHAPGFRPRPYQQAALASFSTRVAEGRRRFYLVSPPGSGKTLLGLSMATELGAPTLALSPTTTIAQQWLSRLDEHWVCLDDARAQGRTKLSTTTAPDATDAALLSLTYQRIASSGQNGELHDNVLRLHGHLRRLGVRTLLLDECHHLSQRWGDAVLALAAALEDPFVIGLTATPLDGEARVLGDLFGPPDHVISLPSVVRNGDLAPYQDLCHTVAPAPDEASTIDAALGRFESLFQTLCRPASDHYSLPHWIAEIESDPRLEPDERERRLLERFERDPDLVIAICRMGYAEDREPSVGLPYLPELYEPVSLADRLLLAAHYTREVLLADTALAQGDLAQQACAILAEWGYEIGRTRISWKRGKVADTVGFSRQKLDGMASILRTEMRHLGDELRVLVLTDYEFPPEGSAALSCLDVMDKLTTDGELDELDPVLVTGTSLLVDDDLWQAFKARADEFARRQAWKLDLDMVPERRYVRVLADGKAVDTTAAVQLATWLFEQGICRCLIGTRALLGEGWDCRRLNTLVDLTVVTSGVSVNQLRGRSLRLDPDNRAKVANNWDVLCVSAVGDRSDFERIVRRHEQLYGVTDDGRIERGIGHFHARFAHRDPLELHAEHETINRSMHERAADRGLARRRWRVGEPFADRDWSVLSFAAPRAGGGSGRSREENASPVLTVVPSQLARHRIGQTARLVAGVLGGAGVLGASTAASLGGAMTAGLACLPVIWAVLSLTASRRRFLRQPDLAETLVGLARVLALASDDDDLSPEAVTRQDGSLRVAWARATPEQSDRLSTALAELLGPVLRQRYLIVEPLREVASRGLGTWLGRATEDERAFPVPRLFGNRTAADKLLALWRTRRHADAALVHTRTEEGQSLARRLRSRPALPAQVRIGRVWA